MAAANPFPALPIADPHELAPITVHTPAIDALLSRIDDKLAVADGDVLALIGGYGSGKTHIAGEAVRHVRGQARGLYVRAQGTFVDVWRGFVRALGFDAIRETMESRYRRAVAEVITGFALPEEVTQHLLAEATTPSPTANTPWANSRILLEQVQPSVEEELRDTTVNTTFATVLTLLLRTGFDDAVFEWISGGKPAAVLVDRGIEHAIDSDVAALEALGALLLLCGRGTVLVIDELHTVPFDGAGVVEALKKLFEVAVLAGTVVVLAGAPDYLDALPRDAVQRIGQVLYVQPLTAGHVAELVNASQDGHPGRLDATDVHLMGCIADLSNGNPRNVVRLCHQLYRRAGNITRAGVREVALRLFRDATPEQVRAETGRALTALGLPHVRDHERADYYIPSLDAALLIVDAVFDDAGREGAVDRVAAVRAGAQDTWPQVIIVGNVVADRYVTRLAEVSGAIPLCYDYQTFHDDLRGALTSRVAGHATTTAHEEAVAAFASHDTDAVRLLDALGRAYDELCAATSSDWLPVSLRSLSSELRTAVRRRR